VANKATKVVDENDKIDEYDDENVEKDTNQTVSELKSINEPKEKLFVMYYINFIIF